MGETDWKVSLTCLFKTMWDPDVILFTFVFVCLYNTNIHSRTNFILQNRHTLLISVFFLQAHLDQCTVKGNCVNFKVQLSMVRFLQLTIPLWFGMSQFRKMGSLDKDPFLLHFIKILCIQGMLHKFLAPKSHSGCLDISLKKSNLVKNGHFWRFLGFNFRLSPWYQMVLWGCIYGTKTHLFDQ